MSAVSILKIFVMIINVFMIISVLFSFGQKNKKATNVTLIVFALTLLANELFLGGVF